MRRIFVSLILGIWVGVSNYFFSFKLTLFFFAASMVCIVFERSLFKNRSEVEWNLFKFYQRKEVRNGLLRLFVFCCSILMTSLILKAVF